MTVVQPAEDMWDRAKQSEHTIILHVDPNTIGEPSDNHEDDYQAQLLDFLPCLLLSVAGKVDLAIQLPLRLPQLHTTVVELPLHIFLLIDGCQQVRGEILVVRLKALKGDKAKLKSDNGNLTSNLLAAIDEKEDMERELSDCRVHLKEAKRKLDDEINLSSHAKEKAQKEVKQRTDEIARLKEDCSKMESELTSQFGTHLKQRDEQIEKLESEIEWLKANQASGSIEQQEVDENGLLLRDSSEGTSEGDSSMGSSMENSGLEDLDDFINNIQKYHGKGMKEQSADPELLKFVRSQPVHSPSKSTGSRKSDKSPKGRPSMLRRMSTFFFTQ